MPNQPRPDNPPRVVRVDDALWRAVLERADADDTTASEVVREALRRYVKPMEGDMTNAPESDGTLPGYVIAPNMAGHPSIWRENSDDSRTFVLGKFDLSRDPALWGFLAAAMGQ